MYPQQTIFGGTAQYKQGGMVGPVYPETGGMLDTVKTYANKQVPLWQAGLAAAVCAGAAYYVAKNYGHGW